MDKPTRTEIDRRTFVRGGLTAVIGLSCLSEGLTEALALARTTNKPVLTERSLNRLFSQSRGKGKLRELVAQVRPDIKGWLTSTFTLTSAQQRATSSLTTEQLGKLQRVLRFVEDNGGRLDFNMNIKKGGCEITARAKDGRNKTLTAEIEVETGQSM